MFNIETLSETLSADYARVDEIPNGLLDNGLHALTVGVDPKDVFCVARKLQGWFHQKARASLLPWLASLAEDRGLRFKGTFVKNQVSLWGSCSEKRNINLNQNLLFLPKHLVEYVLHHELTHLDHMNLSVRFWGSYTRVLPNCKELRREIGALNADDIPMWASPGLNRV